MLHPTSSTSRETLRVDRRVLLLGIAFWSLAPKGSLGASERDEQPASGSLILALNWRAREVLVLRTGAVDALSVKDGRLGPARRLSSLDAGVYGDISPRGDRAAVLTSNRRISLWDRMTGQSVRLRAETDFDLTACAWSEDGRLAVGMVGSRVQILAAGARQTERLLTLDPSSGPIARLSWLPHSRRLCICTEGGDIVVYDSARKEARRLEGYQPSGEMGANWAYPDPSGTRIALFSQQDWSLHIWNAGRISEPPIPTGSFNLAAAWRSDGVLLAFSAANSLWVYNVITKQKTELLPGNAPSALVWSPEGSDLAIGEANGSIRVLKAVSKLVR